MVEGKVRFGIIGFGNVAPTYLYALQNNPDSEVVSIAESNFEKFNNFSNHHGNFKGGTYNNYRDMIDSNSLDAVVIATSPYAHKEQALYCAKKGLDILCERSIIKVS